ncbi:fructan 6-exohydrolase-like [Bidens hawaiensis]|uniref:fructan 6-exohydrolase-like n=1 Tax=Bidens hawaiensis TaxID=980011 RepID=UPI0040499498
MGYFTVLQVDTLSRQVQDLAWPKNLSDPFLREWVKYSGNPIVTAPEGVRDDCFRDPSTVWRGLDDVWRMVVGGDRDNNSMAFLYKSTDFVNWTLCEHPLAESGQATGTWECPDFFPVALNSTNGLNTSVYNGSVLHVMKATFKRDGWYTVGEYTPDHEHFLPKWVEINRRNDGFENRRVLWAWVPEADSQEDDVRKGCAGVQSFPRAVWLDESGRQLTLWPVEEIESLREGEVRLENKKLEAGSVLEIEGVTASQADVIISFKLENLKEAEVVNTSSVNPKTLCTKRDATSAGAFGPFGLSTVRNNINTTSFGTFVDMDPRYSDILPKIDHSVIENFGAEGKACITSRVYPLFAFNNGTQNIKISHMRAWSMKNVEFITDKTAI